MKPRNILTAVLLTGSLIFASSCQGLLDIPQHSVSAIDSYYKTDAEAEEGIIACYGQMRTLETSTTSLQFMKTHLSDDVWSGGGGHYDGSYYQLSDYTFSSDYGSIATVYTNLYTLVYRCNVVIEHVTGTSDIMKRAVAEAKVFRAFAYFNLTILWGTPPLVDHTLSDTEYMQPNATTADLWAFIEKDLNEAIDSGALTQKSSVSEVTNRATKQFAQALLGKSLLFEKKYSDAATMLDNVINSKLYELNPDLSNAGIPSGANSVESVFEINSNNDRQNSTANNNFKWTFEGLRGEKYSYDVTKTVFASSTFGFQNPREDLYDAFVAVEGKNGYRLNNTIVTFEQMRDVYGTSPILEITDNEGYWNFKYRILKSLWAGYFYANNTRVMKYNEVILLAAEAHFMNDDAPTALKYINLIRTRAQAPTLTSITLDNIKTESRLELCFEGQRYENLIRWGDAAAALAHNGEKNPALQTDGTVKWTSYNKVGECGFTTGKHELWPFPATEMSVNANMKQNPGW